MQSRSQVENSQPASKYAKVDIKNKILKISQDNPYFSKPIKKIQDFKGLNIFKESIYNFVSNLNTEQISNEDENQLDLVLFHFISSFNKYLKKTEIKAKTYDNENYQSELYAQYLQFFQEKSKEDFYGPSSSDFPEQTLTTQEDVETKIQTDIKDIVRKINEFLETSKFSSEKEVETVEIDELKNFLEIHSNNECFKETITPILKDNYWQINFPSWADKIESLSSEQLIASFLEIIITLSYQTYKVANIKVISIEGQKDLNDAIKENDNKYKCLNNYSAFPPLFETIMKKVFSPPKKLLCNQLEEYLQSHNIKRDETIDTTEKCEAFIEDILNEFKADDMIKFREKMRQYFEKLTFYYIDDIKQNKYKHIVYYYLREFIMKYTPFSGLTDNINNIVNKLDKMNEEYNKYKEIILKEAKNFIYDGLKKYFTLKFVDYGSRCSNLNLPESDLDFRLFYKKKDEINPVNQNKFLKKLKKIFKKMKRKKIVKNDNQYYLYYLKEFSLLNKNPLLSKLEYYICNVYKNELIIVKIDVTFEKDTRDEKGENYSEEIIKKRIKHINDELAKYPSMRKNILVIKKLLKHFGMNSTYNKGISSYISTLLYDNSVKMFKSFGNNNHGVQLLLFLLKFSNYQYNYYIDKNGKDQFLTDKDKDSFIIKNPKYGNNGNNKRFYVDDPVLIEHSNVASPCYNTEKVKNFFSWLFLEIKDGNNITQILNGKYLHPETGSPFINNLKE